MKSIFKPVREEDALWEVGGHYINREEMVEYNKAPDTFVAQWMGFDNKEQFYDYRANHDRCSALTKKGKPCRGFLITASVLRTGPSKVKSNRDVPIMASEESAKRILRLAGYLRTPASLVAQSIWRR